MDNLSNPDRLIGHPGGVRALVELPGDQIASASEDRDGEILVWDLSRKAESNTIPAHGESVEAIGILPQHKIVSASSTVFGEHGSLLRREIDDPSNVRRLHGMTGGVTYLAVHEDGTLVAGSRDGDVAVAVYTPDDDEPFATLLRSGCGGAGEILLATDGVLVGSTGDYENDSLWIWEYSTSSSEARTFWSSKARLETHSASLPSTEVTALVRLDAERFVSASHNGDLIVWNLGHIDRPLRLEGHPAGTITAVASLGGGRFLSAGYKLSGSSCLKFWDLNAGASSRELGNHSKGVRVLLPLSHNQFASGGANGELHIWDASNLNVVGTLTGEPSDWLASLPNGMVVAASRSSMANEGVVRLWDLHRKRSSLLIAENHSSLAVAGNTLFLGRSNGSIDCYSFVVR